MASPAKKIKREFLCDICGNTYTYQRNLDAHKRTHDPQPPHQCAICGKVFDSNAKLLRHNKSLHIVAPPAAPQLPPNEPPPVIRPPRGMPKFMELPEQDPEDPLAVPEIEQLIMDEREGFASVYYENWNLIKTEYIRHTSGGIMMEYNLRLPNAEINIDRFLEKIYANHRTAFDINIHLGYITLDVETGEFYYFWPGWTSRVFDDDERITSAEDMQRFRDRLAEKDLFQWCLERRWNTKNSIQLITNVRVQVFNYRDVPIRGLIGKLPKYIRDRKSITSLDTNGHGTPFDDNLCFFRCLALHRDPVKHYSAAVEASARRLAQAWMGYKSIEGPFNGIKISELGEAELFFQTPIYVYQLQPWIEPVTADDEEEDEELFQNAENQVIDEKKQVATAIARDDFVAELVRRPDNKFKSKDGASDLLLHLYENDDMGHFSYINCFYEFAKCYKCPLCERLDHNYTSSQQHVRICNGNIQKHIFPGYCFNLPKDVFELLAEEPDPELHLPNENMRFYPYVASFDFECFNRNIGGPTFDSLKPLDEEPTPMLLVDPIVPDYNAFDDNFILSNWTQIRTNYSTINGKYVIRCDSPDLVAMHVDAVAQQQTCRFSASVNLLVRRNGNKLAKLRMFSSKHAPIVYSRASLQTYLQLLSTENVLDRLRLHGDTLLAVEVLISGKKVEFTKILEAASVALASNIPGHIDETTKLPRADFILSDGDTAKMVKKFLDKLNALSLDAEAELRPRYQAIIDRLESRILLHTSNIDRMLDPLLTLQNVAPTSSFYKQLEFCRGFLSPEDVAYLRHEKEEQQRLTTILKMLNDWLAHLPVLGFNSGAFDLMLIRKELLPMLVKERDEGPDKNFLSVLRKNGSAKYLQIKTGRLIFLDQSQYLAQGTSYAAWLKAYHIEQNKGIWCHDFFTSLDVLKLRELPCREAFRNELKDEDLSPEDYAYLQKIWISEKMETLSDLLEWYNKLDTVPFIAAAEKMAAWFRDHRGIDMRKQGLSLPSLALRDMLRNSDEFTYLVTEQKTKDVDNSDLHDLITENIVGGPSVVFHRHLERGVSKIREADGGTKICREITGYDMASLYLWATSQQMPVGIGRRYRRVENETFFRCKSMYPNCQSELEWVSWMQHKYNLTHREKIRFSHRFNEDQVPRVAGYSVDALCRRKKMVLQFNGCAFHGCPDPNCKIKPIHNAEDLKKKQAHDQRMKKVIEAAGYTITSIQYCEWQKMKKSNAELREFLQKHFQLPPRKSKTTQEELLRRIANGKLFGVALVDIHTPDHLKEKFKEFPAIFKTVKLRRDQLGPVMRKYAEEHNIMKEPRHCLVSSYFGERILLATPLLQFYIQQGLVVTHVYEVTEWKPRAVFKRFADEIVAARRAADNETGQAAQILAELQKLLGNACYGKTLTRIDRHKKIILCNRRKFHQLRQSPRYSQVDEITDDLYEVSVNKPRLIFRLPKILGFFVYQYAKLRMLQFYHLCIDKYIDRSDYMLAFMDTDSLYIGLSSPTIDEIIKPELRAEFEKVRYTFFADPKLGKYAEREAGIAKTEFKEGEEYIALNSKCYYIKGRTKDKRSSKGVPLRNKLSIDHYRSVLQTKEPVNALIKGFKRIQGGGQLSMFEMSRIGLQFFYGKRNVLEDLESTTILENV